MITLLDTRPTISARYLDDKSLKESIDALTFQLDRAKHFKQLKKKPRSDETRWVYDHFNWFTRCQRTYCKEFTKRFGAPHPKIYEFKANKSHRPLKGPDGEMSLISYIHESKLALRWRKRNRLLWTNRTQPKFMKAKIPLIAQGAPRRDDESTQQYLSRTRKDNNK